MSIFGPPNVEEMKIKGNIKGLKKALTYQKDPKIRIEAAKALVENNNKEAAVESLLAALKDRDSGVRQAVAEALSKIGLPVVEPLIATLKADDDKVSQAAAEALSKIGLPAVEPLIATLKADDDKVSQAAAEALSKIGLPVVEPLITVLKDGDNKVVRKRAAWVLGQIGDARAVEPLIAALGDSDKSVRSTVVISLGEIRDARAIKPLIDHIDHKYSKGMIVNFLAIDSLTATICDTLLLFGKLAQRPLIEALSNDDNYIQKVATMLLEKLGWQPEGEDGARYYIANNEYNRCIDMGADAIIPLIEVIMNRRRGLLDQRKKAAYALLEIDALKEIGNTHIIDQLSSILRHDNNNDKDSNYWHLQNAAMSLLVKIGTPAIDIFIPLLNHPEQAVRFNAAEGLGEIGDKRAVMPLIEALQDTDREVLLQVIRALGKIKDPRSVDPLKKMLMDKKIDRTVEEKIRGMLSIC